MLNDLPLYMPLIFLACVFFTILMFLKSAAFNKKAVIVISIWLILQSVLGLSGFYTAPPAFPPRFMIMIVPFIIYMIFGIFIKSLRDFNMILEMKHLHILHIVRIPVEIVLFWLASSGKIPLVMTFEGKNFDIFSGITAPLVYYFGFVKKILPPKIILIWNFLCLGLVLNVVIHGILSVPSIFQQISFETPNIGILYFPFNLLPSVVVTLVFYAHLVSIAKLMKNN